jgi:hypothetical protein
VARRDGRRSGFSRAAFSFFGYDGNDEEIRREERTMTNMGKGFAVYVAAMAIVLFVVLAIPFFA